MKKTTLLLMGLLMVTTSCQPVPTPAPTLTPTIAPTLTAISIPTSTPVPPTPTSTPTATNTPTLIPTPTGTSTPTVTPTPNFSSAIITISDLPSGFQPASPADLARLNLSEVSEAKTFWFLGEGRPRNLFVFLRGAPSYEEVMSVLIYPLSPMDAALIDSLIASPDRLIRAVGTGVSSGGSGSVRSSNTIPGADKFGDRSVGVSLVSSGSTVPLRWDVLLARRSAFAELIYLVYIDGRQPSTSITDLARILDGRLAIALGSK